MPSRSPNHRPASRRIEGHAEAQDGRICDVDGRAEFDAVATLMVGRASPEVENAVGASLDDRVRQSIELCSHGEEVLALENLIDNLYEFSVVVSAEEEAVLLNLARRWSVPERRQALLQALVEASE